MCGRYSLVRDFEEFLELAGIEPWKGLAPSPRYNIAPGQPVLALVADPHPRLEALEWGYIPVWVKPDATIRPVINARAETLLEKPFFRGAFNSSRCAILADGFYEWKKVGREKHPFRIGLKDGGVFAMAGLWSFVRSYNGSSHATCAIITTGANEMMKGIHDRMPAILRPEDLAIWLDRMSRHRELLATLEPYPADQMAAYEVSTLVNNAANDIPSCITPIEEEN